jgi:hypothetical protein
VNVPVPEVAWVGQLLEAGSLVQIAEEAPQEVGSLLSGLVRDSLHPRGVLLVVQLEQHLQHMHGVRMAGSVARQDVALGQP